MSSDDDLEPYNPFDKKDTKCLLCQDDIDDPIKLGKKLHAFDVTAHHYCLLLSPPLTQSEENNGLMGFDAKKIKLEEKRSLKLVRLI